MTKERLLKKKMFDTSLLSQEPARYVVVAESVLPIFLILLSFFFFPDRVGKQATQVQGRPSGMVVGIIWMLLSILMFFLLFIAALNVDTTTLIVFASFAFLFIIGCVAWVYHYGQNQKTDANYVMMFVLLMSFLMVICSTQFLSSVDSYAPITISILTTPFAAWSTIAFTLGMFELNV